MAFDDYTFFFKIYMLRNPIKGVLLSSIQKQQKSSYQNYFLQADFSLSEKLHLETGLAF
jgi:iron complex outermembrane receptor protein